MMMKVRCAGTSGQRCEDGELQCPVIENRVQHAGVQQSLYKAIAIQLKGDNNCYSTL